MKQPITTTSKREITVEHLKHPFSKKKLKITDKFQSNKNFTCGQCSAIGRPTVYSVESDVKVISEYVVVQCRGCEDTRWYTKTS